MTVSEYAKKMNSTVEIILKLCENLGISVNQPNDILEENDLVLLDDYFQDLLGLNDDDSAFDAEPMSTSASSNGDIGIDLDVFCRGLETFKPINEKLNSLNAFLSTIEHADLETAHLIDEARTKINSQIEEIENIDKKINNIKTVLEESNPELAILFAYLSGEYLDEDGLFDEERIADDIEDNHLSDTFSISELASKYNNEYKQRALYAEIFSSEKGNKYVGEDGLIDIDKIRKAVKEKGLEDNQEILDIVSGANTYATQYMNGKFNDKNGVPNIEKMKKYLKENQITDIYGITELAGKSAQYDEMQKNQFTMLEQMDEKLAEYKEKLSEIDDEMKERDSFGYKLVDAILPNLHQGKTLEELQKDYDDLYTAMAAIKTEKDVLMDSAYFMYGTKGNFKSLSTYEGRIANYKVDKSRGKFTYYDRNGKVLDQVSDIEAGMYFASIGKDKYTTFSFSEYRNTYKYMTEDEKKVAHYLMNTGNTEGLEEYFQFKENHANARQGQEEAEKVLEQIDRYYSNGAAWASNMPTEDRNKSFYAYNRDTNLAGGTIGHVENKAAREKYADSAAYQSTLGLLAKEGFFDGILNFTDGIVNLFDADGVVSARQYKTSYIMQGLNERYSETQVEELVTTGVYEISSSIGNMTIPSVIGLVTRCPKLGATLMGVSAAGNAREEGLQSGMTGTQAWTYGILSGVSEGAMEYFLGGILGLNKLDKIPGIKGYFAKMLNEGIEESAQTMLEPFLEAAATGRYVSAKSFKEVAKSGIYGMITAGLMNGGNLAINGVMYQINQVLPTNMTSILNKYEGMDLTNEETISALTTDLLESGASVSDSGNVLGLPAGTDLNQEVSKNNALLQSNEEMVNSIGPKNDSLFKNLSIENPTMQDNTTSDYNNSAEGVQTEFSNFQCGAVPEFSLDKNLFDIFRNVEKNESVDTKVSNWSVDAFLESNDIDLDTIDPSSLLRNIKWLSKEQRVSALSDNRIKERLKQCILNGPKSWSFYNSIFEEINFTEIKDVFDADFFDKSQEKNDYILFSSAFKNATNKNNLIDVIIENENLFNAFKTNYKNFFSGVVLDTEHIKKLITKIEETNSFDYFSNLVLDDGQGFDLVKEDYSVETLSWLIDIMFMSNNKSLLPVLSDFFCNDPRAKSVFSHTKKNTIISYLRGGIKFGNNIIENFEMLKSDSLLEFRELINLAEENCDNPDYIEEKRKKYYDQLIEDNQKEKEIFDKCDEILRNPETDVDEELRKINLSTSGKSENSIYRYINSSRLAFQENNQQLSEVIVDGLFQDNIYNVWVNIKELLKYDNYLPETEKVLSQEKRNFYKLILDIDNYPREERITLYNKLKDQNINLMFYEDMRSTKDLAYRKIKEKMITPSEHSEFISKSETEKNGVITYDLRDAQYYMLIRKLNGFYSEYGSNFAGGSYSLISNNNTDVFHEGTGIIYGYNTFDIDKVEHMFETDSFSSSVSSIQNRSGNSTNRPNRISTASEIADSGGYSEIILKNQVVPEKGIHEMRPDFVVVIDETNEASIKASKELNVPLVIIRDCHNSIGGYNYFFDDAEGYATYSQFDEASRFNENQRRNKRGESKKDSIDFEDISSLLENKDTQLPKSEESPQLGEDFGYELKDGESLKGKIGVQYFANKGNKSDTNGAFGNIFKLFNGSKSSEPKLKGDLAGKMDAVDRAKSSGFVMAGDLDTDGSVNKEQTFVEKPKKGFYSPYSPVGAEAATPEQASSRFMGDLAKRTETIASKVSKGFYTPVDLDESISSKSKLKGDLAGKVDVVDSVKPNGFMMAGDLDTAKPSESKLVEDTKPGANITSDFEFSSRKHVDVANFKSSDDLLKYLHNKSLSPYTDVKNKEYVSKYLDLLKNGFEGDLGYADIFNVGWKNDHRITDVFNDGGAGRSVIPGRAEHRYSAKEMFDLQRSAYDYRITMNNASNIDTDGAIKYVEKLVEECNKRDIDIRMKNYWERDAIILYCYQDQLLDVVNLLEDLSDASKFGKEISDVTRQFGPRKPFTFALNDDSYYGISMYACELEYGRVPLVKGFYGSPGTTFSGYTGRLLKNAYNKLLTKYGNDSSKITVDEFYDEIIKCHKKYMLGDENSKENIPLWMNRRNYQEMKASGVTFSNG